LSAFSRHDFPLTLEWSDVRFIFDSHIRQFVCGRVSVPRFIPFLFFSFPFRVEKKDLNQKIFHFGGNLHGLFRFFSPLRFSFFFPLDFS